jgi:GNAT superfamily N-acetyltransferase
VGYQVQVDRVDGPEGGVAEALTALHDAVDAEIAPDDWPHHPAEVAGRHFVFVPDHPVSTWLARIGRTPAGWARAEVSETGENPDVAELELLVAPGQRGRGVGRALAAAALEGVAEQGRTSVVTWTRGDRGDRFAARLGLTHRQDERCSRLRVQDLDTARQDAWIAAPRARRAGYRVVTWGEEGCPDELVEAWCVAALGMHDAPRDAIEWVPEKFGPVQARRYEEMRRARGDAWRISLALDSEGRPAGVTELFVNRWRPQVGNQGDTAVLAEHRGLGLGRWLKAANLRAVMETWPDLAVVQTYNAETNPWMLDINVSMGFRPHCAYKAQQGAVSTARARL